MDEYQHLPLHDQLYKTFMITEANAIHSSPMTVFTALKMRDGDIVDWVTETLEGPANNFTDRLDVALGEITEKYVHHLIDVELGVD